MQTDVVKVEAVDAAEPLEDLLVLEERPVTLAAGDQNDVRVDHVGEGPVGVEPERGRCRCAAGPPPWATNRRSAPGMRERTS